MRVFIQKREGEFINLNCYVAFDGFTQLGYEVIAFEEPNLALLPLAYGDIVCGNIGVVHKALQLLDIPSPPVLNIPNKLLPFCGRRISTTTLKDVRTLHDVPIFIKPRDIGKQFTGHVVREFRDLIETAGFPDDTVLISSKVVAFVTEYRTFVLRGAIVGSKQYKGDFRRIIDFNVIEAAVAAWENAPVAYSIDFGLTDEGQTLLVEVNDAYSLGCYGLTATTYARLIEARWQQMSSGRKETSNATQ